jgi:hypothetical protein
VEAKLQSAAVAGRRLPVEAGVAVKQPREEVAGAKQQAAGVAEATRPSVEAAVNCQPGAVLRNHNTSSGMADTAEKVERERRARTKDTVDKAETEGSAPSDNNKSSTFALLLAEPLIQQVV